MKITENDYSKESIERWGNTDAYREHEQKIKNKAAENPSPYF